MTKMQTLEINASLSQMARSGLRTLCVAQRVVPDHIARQWAEAWRKAATSLSRDRETKLAEVGEEMEREMEFLGITAIEDQLQDEVPQVLEDFALSGITLWMLTGYPLSMNFHILSYVISTNSTLFYSILFYL